MRGNNALLVTPFTADFAIDEASLRTLIDFVIDNHVDGVLALGTTGEFFTLSAEEKRRVIDIVIGHTNKRLPVAVGVADSGTRLSMELAQYAQARGADSIMIPPPYYYPAGTGTLERHFSLIAQSVGIDVSLYDGGGGIEIPVDIIKAVNARAPNVKYIKASVLQTNKVNAIRTALGDRVQVLCGDEVKLLPDLNDGAIGMATAIGNVLPRISSRICREFHTERASAFKLYCQYVAPWVATTGVIKAEFILCHKVALALMKIIKHPVVRDPIGTLAEARVEQIEFLLHHLDIL